MRRPFLLLTLATVALAAAACGTSAPGWTYAPPTPSPTPGPSVEASAVPSAAASGVPGEGADVVLVAANTAFDKTEISATANEPFTIKLLNNDAGVPHNVEIKDGSGMSMFKGEIITGVTEITYEIPALPQGTYQFVCTVHPNMTGTLSVGS